MNMVNPTSRYFDRKAVTRDAISRAINARKVASCDLISPINIYDVCESHGVTVRFTPINMEGMYDRKPMPRIHISALRPLVRRNLTGAHELGHHVFGHGSTIDEISEQAEIADHDNPIEFAANQFAYNLMMPTLGIRNAFAIRGITPATANPIEMFRVSSHFSVGYATLLSHLRYGLSVLPHGQFERLSKSGPKDIRRDVLGFDSKHPMVLVDEQWKANTVDAESSDYIVFPEKLLETPKLLEFVHDNQYGAIYRARLQGLARAHLPSAARSLFVRVCKRTVIDDVEVGYVGLAKYRHMEDDDDDL